RCEAVVAGGVPVGGQGRRPATQQQLVVRRATAARRDRRAGGSADRRAERPQPRSVSTIQRDPRQRTLPHRRRAAARPSGARGPPDPVPALGRGGVRAADRRRERDQPDARAIVGMGRIARQLLTETLILTIVAGGLGLLLGWGGLRTLSTFGFEQTPQGTA